MQKFSVSESEAQTCTMSDIISTKYKCDLNTELSSLRRQIQDNKLYTFSNIYSNFSLQDYLSFGLPKDKTRELAKLRISAHDLLIERGRYFRPRIPRESRLCTSCNEIEDEEHFMLYCSMNSELRNDLFKTLNITYHDLKPGSDASFNAFVHLMNPATAEETKYVCEFITMSLVLR